MIGNTTAVLVLLCGAADLKPVKRWIETETLLKRFPKESQFADWLKDECANPKTLLSSTRQVIRRRIRTNPTHKINQLPLPVLSRNYLNLMDLDEIQLN